MDIIVILNYPSDLLKMLLIIRQISILFNGISEDNQKLWSFRFPIAHEEPRITIISKDHLVVSWNSEEVSLTGIRTSIYRNTESVMIIILMCKKNLLFY
jgi:hypothetical protein